MLFQKFFLAVLILFIFASCIKTNCDDTVCQNNGLCVNGHCSCATGYEGDHCEQVWNAKFEGHWQNREVKADSVNVADTSHYAIIVSAGSTPNIFLIDSLQQQPGNIVCEITGKYSFRIRTQYSRDSVLYIESGQGSINAAGNLVSASYVFRLNNKRYNGVMNWSK